MAIWLDSKEECWDEGITNFIISERDELGWKSSTIRSKISGIRFRQITSGDKIISLWSGRGGGFR